MPVNLILDPERQLTITACAGVVTDEELIRARRQLLANPAFDPSFDRIWDFHDVTGAQVTEAVVAQLVAQSPLESRPICRAVVMSESTAPLAAILHFIDRTRLANHRIAAFPTRASAMKWITAVRFDLPPI